MRRVYRIVSGVSGALLTTLGAGLSQSAMAFYVYTPATNPQPAFGDGFGTSIAGIGNLVVVGAPKSDEGATDAGSAYLFNANPFSPTYGDLLTQFQAPTPSPFGDFGSSIAAVGRNVVIGESFRYASPQTGKPGAAYLFDGNPLSPTFGDLLTTFQAPGAHPLDMFGFSMAAVENNVLVGAFNRNNGTSGEGAAYLFDGNPLSPTFGDLLTTFENPNPAPDDLFGVAVTAIGKNVLIGAFRDDAGGIDSGTAYLFDGDPASPTFGNLLKTFVNPNPSPSNSFGQNDEFGHSVARVGNNCLIGAFREDVGGFDTGSAYLYDCNPLSPTFGNLLTTFVNPSPISYGVGNYGENFGFSLAGLGNYALIGSWREYDNQLALAGAVFVYDANPLSPTFGQLLGSLSSPSPTSFGSYATSIAVSNRNIWIGELGSSGGAGTAHLYSWVNPPTISSSPLPQLALASVSTEVPEPSLGLSLLGVGLGMVMLRRKRF